MYRGAIGVLQAALILAAGTASADYPSRGSIYAPRVDGPALPFKQVDQLLINTSNRYRLVVEDKCEAAGVSELLQLLKVSRFEEMWAFVPADERGGRCTWYELGREVVAAGNEATVRVDRDFLTSLMRRHDELRLYHFHPLVYFERCANRRDCNAFGLPIRPEQIAQARLIDNLRYTMPSPEDVYFMMDVTWQFDQERAGTGKLINRVATPYGIVGYALTQAGKERFADDRHLRTAGLYIKLVAANALVDENIGDIIARNPDSVEDALRKLVQKLNSRYLRVYYIPLETYGGNR